MNFKHLFLTTLFAASFGLVACDNSSSADSSDDNSNKKSTEKSRTSSPMLGRRTAT